MKLVPQLSFLLLLILLASCKEAASPEAKQAPLDLIPKAVSVQPGNESLVVKDISFSGSDSSGARADNPVYFATVSDPELGEEGYEINITPESITVSANKPAGLFYGSQTLSQIGVKNGDGIEFATGKIRDYPTFGWRGSMLDMGRHFFTVEEVKRYVDLISYYKMNVLHLHLTDDQGWRIEIKSWPKLTEIGGKTQVGGNGGGFYTQEQYKDIVAYAAQRFVTIVPEVDMPSHINAALASYPELNKDGKAPALYEGTEVGFNTLARHTPKMEEQTLKFVNDVVREISEMTPGPYFHIGGDEAHVTKKPDYLAFVNAFKKIVEANGKHMVGWEEIAQANIGAGDIAQHWHSKEFADSAAQKGAKVLMSPSTRVYLDMKYDTASRIGYTWAALIEVDDSYNWKIEDMIPNVSLDNVVGVEAPLWGETLKNFEDVEYLLFPRLPGIAEIGWSPQARDWNEYKVRLGKHGKKMEEMGINFYRSTKVDWVK